MLAAENGHETVVVALHGLGADVNAKNNVSLGMLDSGVESSCLCVRLFVHLRFCAWRCFGQKLQRAQRERLLS
jgi:hypothetical protein